MKKILSFLVCLLVVGEIRSQYITIPDAAFAQWLNANVPSAMSGNQMDTTNTVIKTMTYANVSATGISDLTGIQYFSALTNLDCSSNQLSNLPSLPNLLDTLNCYGNQLTSLPPLQNSLSYLICQSNAITVLPALPASLKVLNCSYNPLSSLNITNTLKVLYCGGIGLSSLPPLSTSSLEYLDCNGNNLSSLPTLPVTLTSLVARFNQLTSLPALPSSLRNLDVQWNQLTTLPALPDSLRYFNCVNNNIPCFSVFPDSLNDVIIYNNPFNCLPNYVLPAMNSYTTTPICAAGNSNGCAVNIDAVIGKIYSAIFPNPTTGVFTIKPIDADEVTMEICNINGSCLVSKAISGNTEVDVSSFQNGIYQLIIKSSLGLTREKLMIAR